MQMEIKNMTVDQIEARKAEIAKELETEGARPLPPARASKLSSSLTISPPK